MWYNFIGRGATLRVVCRLCFYLSGLCGIFALVLLWLVYPREVSHPLLQACVCLGSVSMSSWR